MDLNKRDSASSGALFQYSSQVIFLLSGLVFYAFLMHTLTPAFVGEVVLISTLVQIFSSILSFQLQNAFMHFLSYNIDEADYRNHLARTFLAVTIVLTVISYPIFYVSAPLFSGILFHSTAESSVLRSASIFLSLSVCSGLISGIAYGFQWFKKVNIEKAISSIIGYVLASIFAIYFHSILGVIIALSLGQVYFVVLILYKNPMFARTNSAGIGNLRAKQIFGYSLPLVLTVFVGNSANHVDKIVTAAFMSVSSVGIYNLSLMVATGLYGSIQSINQILLPKMSEIYARNNLRELEEAHGTGVRLLSSFYVPTSVGLVAISRQVVLLVGGTGYDEAVIPLQLILIISAVFAPLMVTSVIPGAIRKTQISYLVAPISFLINLGLSILLIPKYGIIGASLGFAALYPARFLIIYVYTRRWLKLDFGLSSLAKIWIISIVMFAFIRSIEAFFGFGVYSLMYLIPLGVVSYIVLLRIFKALSSDEVSLLLDIIPKKYENFRSKIHRIILGQ